MKIRYYGHLGMMSGLGNAALEYALGLSKIPGVELDLRPMNHGAVFPQRAARLQPFFNREDFTPDVVIVHALPEVCGRLHEAEKITAPAVAMTTWEALNLPASLHNAFGHFQAIVVPSNASARPFLATGLPVHVVPHGYDPELVETVRAAARSSGCVDGAEPYTFYFIGAATRRKNVEGLLRAYALMKSRCAWPTRLRLHCTGPGGSVGASRRVAAAIAATGYTQEALDVEVNTQPVPEGEIWALHLASDCFVSATCGEAWNLPAFEAALVGRHGIIPNGQGSDDFSTGHFAKITTIPAPAANDVLVETVDGGVKMTVTGPQGLTSRCMWVEPDLQQMAELMELAAAQQRGFRRSGVDLPSYSSFRHERVAQTLIDHLKGIL